MTSSGTTNFQLNNASIAVSAFSRIQVRRTQLLPEHMADAYTEFNLLLSTLNNLPVNLWKVDLVTLPLVQGTATYAVDASTFMILDAYISYTGANNDRLIFPISRTEYASYPDKITQQVPTVFWFDRLISPTITLWGVPNSSTDYVLKYYRCIQIQDANTPNGETPDVPYRFLDCLVAGLAHRLARIWKPELETIRKADADEAWRIAATGDVENTDLYITPGLEGYYRQ